MQFKLKGCSSPRPSLSDKQALRLKCWSTRWQCLPLLSGRAPSLHRPLLSRTPAPMAQSLPGRWINGSVGCPCSQNPLPSNAREPFVILPQGPALPDISFHFPDQGHGSEGRFQCRALRSNGQSAELEPRPGV